MSVIEDFEHTPLWHSVWLDTPTDGLVRVSVRRNAGSFTLRFKAGRPVMSAPAGVSLARLREVYASLRPKLKTPPVPVYELGREIPYPEGRFCIMSAADRGALVAKRREGVAVVTIPEGFDISDPANTKAVTSALMRLARPRAANLLIARGRAMAERLRLNVGAWRVGTGLRTLGTCSADRVITLSAACLFLTPELRDYIICHELAHLTEMNHSPRFHALCDVYSGGREKELIAKLKKFEWPIIR